MILVIDNYDSFTYNLVQYFGELKAEPRVFRNDQISVKEIERLSPTHIVISPGPGSPRESGISNEVILQFYKKIPILGVCLGHQCIGHIFGGRVERAEKLMHGKTSAIFHNEKGVFRGLENPFRAGRYHSLIVQEPVPAELQVVARTAEGEVMAIKHQQYPLVGVQFHPESVLTEHGLAMLTNFLGDNFDAN
jgi:anthranilate synthase/aminodeoxychorismate synthase-like glutamine amidotransferase